jgi:signal transduction histidine kinase
MEPINDSNLKLKNSIKNLSYAGYSASAVLFVTALFNLAETGILTFTSIIAGTGAVITAMAIAILKRRVAPLINETFESSKVHIKKASDTAHDIRNSLAVIKMDAEAALLKSNLPSDTKETLEQINSEADKINSLLGH